MAYICCDLYCTGNYLFRRIRAYCDAHLPAISCRLAGRFDFCTADHPSDDQDDTRIRGAWHDFYDSHGALICYALSQILGGNAYLSVYIMGVIIGLTPAVFCKALRSYHSLTVLPLLRRFWSFSCWDFWPFRMKCQTVSSLQSWSRPHSYLDCKTCCRFPAAKTFSLFCAPMSAVNCHRADTATPHSSVILPLLMAVAGGVIGLHAAAIHTIVYVVSLVSVYHAGAQHSFQESLRSWIWSTENEDVTQDLQRLSGGRFHPLWFRMYACPKGTTGRKQTRPRKYRFPTGSTCTDD